MRALVIAPLIVLLAGCGGAASTTRHAKTSASRPQAREIVYLYRVQGDDPLPDSISLRADGTADVRRGGGGAGIKWVKAALDQQEMAHATRLIRHAPWKAFDGSTVPAGGTDGSDDMRYLLRRGPWSITVKEPKLPRGLRPLIRELNAIIENDKGRRTKSLLISRVSASVASG